MAVKRGGLGKGLDSLIPDHKTVKDVYKRQVLVSTGLPVR